MVWEQVARSLFGSFAPVPWGLGTCQSQRAMAPAEWPASVPEINGYEKLQVFFKSKLLILLLAEEKPGKHHLCRQKMKQNPAMLFWRQQGEGDWHGGKPCWGGSTLGAGGGEWVRMEPACLGACSDTAQTTPMLCCREGRLLLLGEIV